LSITDFSSSHETDIETIEGYFSLLAQEDRHNITAHKAPANGSFIF